jgi:fatty-acyl-CoA synthase
MLEAHNGVPMAGAVLNALNYRLDGRTIAFILQHGGAKLLITDAEFSDTVDAALGLCRARFRSWTSSGRMATVTSIG